MSLPKAFDSNGHHHHRRAPSLAHELQEEAEDDNDDEYDEDGDDIEEDEEDGGDYDESSSNGRASHSGNTRLSSSLVAPSLPASASIMGTTEFRHTTNPFAAEEDDDADDSGDDETADNDDEVEDDDEDEDGHDDDEGDYDDADDVYNSEEVKQPPAATVVAAFSAPRSAMTQPSPSASPVTPAPISADPSAADGDWHEPIIDESVVYSPRSKSKDEKKLNDSMEHGREPMFDVHSDDIQPAPHTEDQPSVAETSADSAAEDGETADDTNDADEEGDEELDDENEDEDYEEDEEPVLKYQRIGADVGRVIHSTDAPANDSATCFLPHSKFLVMGLASGSVLILDVTGNEIARYQCHSGAVNDLSLDASAEHLASCSNDNSVCITNLFTKEQSRHAYHSNVRSVALPSNYKHSAMFACGVGDRLCVNKRGWFSSNNIVIHSGEGNVSIVRWRRELIAWANDSGIKVYDVNTSERLTHIKRDRSLSPPQSKPHLVWTSDSQLLIAWGCSVKIGVIQSRSLTKAERHAHPDRSVMRFVQLIAMFQLDYQIAGIAQYAKDSLLILAVPDDGDSDDGPSPPELRLVTYANEELSVDALPINGYENCAITDYSLAAYDTHSDTSTDQCWFILSSNDLITARRRDADDHIAWLLESDRPYDALQASLALVPPSRNASHSVEALTDVYLQSLFTDGAYQQCAKECSRLLGLDQNKWEKWIFLFMENQQLNFFIPSIPIFNPQLKTETYDRIMEYLLDSNDYTQLLTLITSWPKHIYNLNSLITSVRDKIDSVRSNGSDNEVLAQLNECLAELYILNRNYSAALSVFLGLRRHDVFTLIRELNLFPLIADKIETLMRFDTHQAVKLLVENTEAIHGRTVIEQLQSLPQYQFQYLHALFLEQCSSEANTRAGTHSKVVASVVDDYSDLLLELYCQYESQSLIHFLRANNSYSLDTALELTERNKFYNEQVFVLRRMGNSVRALNVLITNIGDVRQAISLIEEEGDDTLWSTLINHSIHNSQFLEQLLDYVGDFNVDLSKLVNQIPESMEIKKLKEKLIRIFSDNALHRSLYQTAVVAVRSDEDLLTQQRLNFESRGVLVGDDSRCQGCQLPIIAITSTVSQTLTFSRRRPRKQRGEILAARDDSMAMLDGIGSGASDSSSTVIFLCSHVWHKDCILKALRKKGKNARAEIREHGMRCLTCQDAEHRRRWRSEHARHIQEEKERAKVAREEQRKQILNSQSQSQENRGHTNAEGGSNPFGGSEVAPSQPKSSKPPSRSSSPGPGQSSPALQTVPAPILRSASPRLNGKSSAGPAAPALTSVNSGSTRPSLTIPTRPQILHMSSGSAAAGVNPKRATGPRNK